MVNLVKWFEAGAPCTQSPEQAHCMMAAYHNSLTRMSCGRKGTYGVRKMRVRAKTGDGGICYEYWWGGPKVLAVDCRVTEGKLRYM